MWAAWRTRSTARWAWPSGKSLVEEDKIDMAKEALEKAKAKGVKLLLPVDNILADKFADDAQNAGVGHERGFSRGLAGTGHRAEVGGGD